MKKLIKNHHATFVSWADIQPHDEPISVHQQLHLDVNDRAYGDEYQSYHCQLINPHTQSMYYGCGKGLGLQSKVSAYYEALEHYITHDFSQRIGSMASCYLPFEQHNRENKIPHVILQHVNATQSIPYPLFLMDPRYARIPNPMDAFDYSQYSWKASDSGIASGCHFVEASIHALNELVERDAYSLFLIDAFIKPSSKPLSLVNKKTLPEALANIVKEIEMRYKDDLD